MRFLMAASTTGIAVELVRDGFVVALEQVLIDAAVLVKQFQRRLQALGQAVDRGLVEALVVDAANFEDHADLSGLRQKHLRPDEAVEIDLLRERARLVVVLENPAKPEHGLPFEPQSE